MVSKLLVTGIERCGCVSKLLVTGIERCGC